jgi:hypothetical protein
MQTLSAKAKSKTTAAYYFKTIAFLTLLLSITCQANAQHCDGCSVNINGPSYVQVGQTVTYTVMTNHPNIPSVPAWDSFGYLYGGEIIDQGKDSNGYQYVTIYFYQTAQWSYLTYEGYLGSGYEYDEIPIYIAP